VVLRIEIRYIQKMRKNRSIKLLVTLWAVAIALLARPTRQQDTGGLPASWFAPIGGAAPEGDAGGTIPLDDGAGTQPIAAGIDQIAEIGAANGDAAGDGGNAGAAAEATPASDPTVNPFNPTPATPEATIPLDGAASTQPIGAGLDQPTPAFDPTVNPFNPGNPTPATPEATIPLDGSTDTQPIGAGLDTGLGVDSNLDPTTGLADPNLGFPDADAEFTPGVQIPVETDISDGPEAPSAPPTPPAPPVDWSFLPEDKQIIFGIEMHGPSLVPWTKTKSWNLVSAIADTVLQSTDAKTDIEAGITDSYRKQVADDSGPGSSVDYSMDSGIQMRLKVNTNSIRVESEVRSMIEAVQSGQLAKDLSIVLGSEVSNITLVTDPEVIPYNSIEDPNESTGGSLPGWIIGAIVGGIIILIPIPAYLLYRRSKRKHLEALAKQQAEAAAARQRMQSRIIKSTGKSFSQGATDFENMESGEYYMGTPNGSISGRQMSANWMNVDASGRSLTPTPGGTPSSRVLQQQHQRALYQSHSLGPGGLPQVNRVGSFSGQGSARGGSVYPVHRYSDSASLPSSSSGGGEGR